MQMQLSPRATRPSKDLNLSEESMAVMEEAESYQMRFGLEQCEPVCILASLVTPGVGFSFDQLKTLPLNASETRGACYTLLQWLTALRLQPENTALHRENAL